MMLFDVSEAPQALYSVSLKMIIPVVLFTAAFFIFALSMAYRAHKRKPTTGYEGILGEIGEALTDISPTGKVLVHGEYWDARADSTISKGAQIIVRSLERMVLHVESHE